MSAQNEREDIRNARLLQVAEDDVAKRAAMPADLQALLMGLGGPPGRHPEQLLMQAACRHARWCGECGRDLAPAEVVLRLRRTSWRGQRLVCVDCMLDTMAPTNLSRERRADWQAALPEILKGKDGYSLRLYECAWCARPVVEEPRDVGRYSDYRWIPGRRFCCEDHVTAAANARRRVDHEPRDCDQCGDQFTSSRSDARYCSPACRQRAYRVRVSS